MKSTGKAYLALALAIAEALAMTTIASAQIAAPGQDGRAMDANNRVGSGGMNQPGGAGGGGSPNQIIYGNVTGGKRFRGPVGETDPGAFYGPTAGRFSDRFVAGSSGVPQPYQPQTDSSIAQPFYGSSRAAPPPPGTYRLGFSGGYIGTSLTPGTEMGMNDQTVSDQWLSQRLGQSTILGTHSTLIGTQNGEAVLQGTGGDNQDTTLSGSALYGIQPMRSGLDISNDAANAQTAGLLAGPGDRFRYDSAEMRRMRGELESTTDQSQPNAPRGGQQQGVGQSLNGNAQDNAGQQSLNPNGLSNDLQTSQAAQRRFTIVAPELQSEQYREMRRRLAQYENPQYLQLEAQHRARLERQAVMAKMNGGAATQPAVPPLGGPGLGGSATLQQPGMGAMNAQPLKVTSLATGVRAKGLHDMLSTAEDLMRQGKFQSAIDRYDVALQIAPNNPLAPLGRANAELGAGAYRLANADLHRVFSADHATLVAQYDLKSWFPSDRLAAVRKELEDLSAKDTKDEMSEFLLAYIGYNLGEADQAATHLAEARKRADSKDSVLDLLERSWKLPAGQRTSPTLKPDLNK